MNRRTFFAAAPAFAACVATMQPPLMREVNMFYWYPEGVEWYPAYRSCDFCDESASWDFMNQKEPRRMFELLDDGCCCCEKCVPALLRGEFD